MAKKFVAKDVRIHDLVQGPDWPEPLYISGIERKSNWLVFTCENNRKFAVMQDENPLHKFMIHREFGNSVVKQVHP